MKWALELLWVVSGFVSGYCVGSYIESALHEHVSDARPKNVRAWRKFPRLLRPLINTHYSHHVVHHTRTWRKNHVTQFRSKEEKIKLDEELDRRGRHGYVVRMGGYATTLYAEGGLIFAAAPIAAGCAIGWIAPAAFSVPFAAATFIPVLFSWIVHPYLHMSFEEGQRKAPRGVRWFLNTVYCRAMYRHHFIHHRYGGVSNFNLVLGADHMRGRFQKPTRRDIAAMREVGMPL